MWLLPLIGKLYVHKICDSLCVLEDIQPYDFLCSARDTSRYGMGSETPMHPSRTPLHPYMTPMRDPGGIIDFLFLGFSLIYSIVLTQSFICVIAVTSNIC